MERTKPGEAVQVRPETDLAGGLGCEVCARWIAADSTPLLVTSKRMRSKPNGACDGSEARNLLISQHFRLEASTRQTVEPTLPKLPDNNLILKSLRC